MFVESDCIFTNPLGTQFLQGSLSHVNESDLVSPQQLDAS